MYVSPTQNFAISLLYSFVYSSVVKWQCAIIVYDLVSQSKRRENKQYNQIKGRKNRIKVLCHLWIYLRIQKVKKFSFVLLFAFILVQFKFCAKKIFKCDDFIRVDIKCGSKL